MNRTSAAKKMPEKFSKPSDMRAPLSGGARATLLFDPELLHLLNLMADMSGRGLSDVAREVVQCGMQTITDDENNPLHSPAMEAKDFARKEEAEDIARCEERVNEPSIAWKNVPDQVKGRAASRRHQS